MQLTGKLRTIDRLPNTLSVRHCLFVATFDSFFLSDSTQRTASQGSSSNLSVEVTGTRLYPVFPIRNSIFFSVIRADDLPHLKTWMHTRRRFFVTVTYLSTTVKLASARFEGGTARWKKKLDTLCDARFQVIITWLTVLLSFLRPSTPFTLRLYAKRFLSSDILIGKTLYLLLDPLVVRSLFSFIRRADCRSCRNFFSSKGWG
jgi:hypothetical protein